MRHEVSQATEVGSELPISLITFVKIKRYMIKCTVYLFFMKMKLKMLLKMVLIRSVRARLKIKKFVTVLILLFPKNINPS